MAVDVQRTKFNSLKFEKVAKHIHFEDYFKVYIALLDNKMVQNS